MIKTCFSWFDFETILETISGFRVSNPPFYVLSGSERLFKSLLLRCVKSVETSDNSRVSAFFVFLGFWIHADLLIFFTIPSKFLE